MSDIASKLVEDITRELKQAEANVNYYKGAIDGVNLLADRIKAHEDNKLKAEQEAAKA